MALPIIASSLLRVVGSATAQGAGSAAAKKVIRSGATQAGRAAVRPVQQVIAAEAKTLGLKGEARRTYAKMQHARVVEARTAARETFSQIQVGVAEQPAGALPAKVSRQVADLVGKGDLEGAAKVVHSETLHAVRREISDLTTGRRTGVPLKLDASPRLRSVVAEEIVAKVANGQSLTEATRESLVQRSKLKLRERHIYGEEAYEVARAAGKFNKELQKVGGIEDLSPAQQDKVMRGYFGKKTGERAVKDDDGNETDVMETVWFDADENAWSVKDLKKVITNSVYEVNPAKVTADDPMEALTRAKSPIHRAVTGHKQRVKNFEKSFKNSGMEDLSRRLYDDVMEAIEAMSPAEVEQLVRDGVETDMVVWWDSGRQTVSAHAQDLVQKVGLDPDDYYDQELNW